MTKRHGPLPAVLDPLAALSRWVPEAIQASSPPQPGHTTASWDGRMEDRYQYRDKREKGRRPLTQKTQSRMLYTWAELGWVQWAELG